jgi:hypothetical protein
VVEVHTLADEIRIFDHGALIATHPVLEGRGRRRVAPGHRKLRIVTARQPVGGVPTLIPARPRERVVCRSLAVYQAVGRRLAGKAQLGQWFCGSCAFSIG